MERTKTNLTQRAWAAYLKTEGAAAEQPSERCSNVQTLNGLDYVTLRSERRVLAVYRVKKSTGKLRRMKRWPLALGRETSPAHPAVRRHASVSLSAEVAK